MLAGLHCVLVAVLLSLLANESGAINSKDLHEERKEGLIYIRGNSWTKTIERHHRVIVLFYDPACQTTHCKHVYHDFIESAHAQKKICPSKIDVFVDFALADINELRTNRTILQKIGYQGHHLHLPKVFYIYRTHFVPYLHELAQPPMQKWFHQQAHRHNIQHLHGIDDLRKEFGKLHN